MKRLTCVLCKHFEFSAGYAALSDVTPGSEAVMGCGKGVKFPELAYMHEDDFRKAMLTAEACPKFEFAEDLKDPEVVRP